MRTPPTGGILIIFHKSTSLLLRWHNLDMWLRIGWESKRQKGNIKDDSHKNIHIQLKRSEAFDRCINSTINMYLYTTNEERSIQLIQRSSNIIKDDFVHIGVKLAKLNNQRRDILAREMIQIIKCQVTIN